MQFYSAPFTFDFSTSLIEVDVGTYSVDCIDLYTACKIAQASITGILYDPLAKASGLNSLGEGVQVGITVELLGNWQIHFPAGNYIAKISGGNLIGGPGGDPVAYSAGVQTLLLQSAASTVVTLSLSGSVPTAEENAAAVLAAAAVAPIAANAKEMNDATIYGDGSAANLWRGTP